MQKKKEYKNILILGASSDIGCELVKQFLNDGYQVYAHCYLNKKKLSQIINRNLNIIKSDFSKFNDKKLKFFLKFLQKKKINYLINLIGMVDNISYSKSNIQNQLSILKVNTVVPNLITKALIPNMINLKFGRIVNCSSIGVKFGGSQYNYNYSLSKHSSEFIPSELKKMSKKNILVNNLRIGVTNTKIHKKMKRNKKNLIKRESLIPIGRIAQINEIVRYIVFFASKENSYVTNETISIAGGE